MNNIISPNLLVVALFFLLSLITNMVLTYFVRRLARQEGWMSLPAAHHIHRYGIPRLGGIAVYMTFMLWFTVGAVTKLNSTWRHELPVLLAASLLFVVGVVDDFHGLSARTKLVFQIGAGALLYFGGVRLFHSSFHVHTLANLGATILWIVLITNALNLIDGLDGLAAGVALFSIVTLLGLALFGHDPNVAFSSIVLGGALLGFLRYNFHPATIFLGDGGSLFLGAMLGGMAIEATPSETPTLVAVAIPLVAFGIPILELCVSVARRFLSGKRLFSPDKEHIHHRLLQMGLSQRQAVAVLYAGCAICALLSLLLIYPARAMIGVILIIAGGVGCLCVQRLGYPEFDEISRVARRTLEQKRIIINNIMVRKAARFLRGARCHADIVKALDRLLQTGEFDAYCLSTPGFDIHRRMRGDVVMDMREGARNLVGWKVVVDLETVDDGSSGQFLIGRTYRRRSVLLDLNVFFNQLEPALADACLRLEKQGHSDFQPPQFIRVEPFQNGHGKVLTYKN